MSIGLSRPSSERAQAAREGKPWIGRRSTTGQGRALWIAGLLGVSGRYDDLVAATAAYQAPLAAVSTVVSLLGAWVPLVRCLGLPVFVYLAVLHVMAVKAVSRFTWERAVATVLIPLGALLLVACVGGIVVAAVSPPALGTVIDVGY